MHKILILLFTALTVLSCSTKQNYEALEARLNEFVADKDANIGIAVIIDGRDTVVINGLRPFPMLSVYKLPIALAFGEYCRNHNISLNDSVLVTPAYLHTDTYSPMLDKYPPTDSARISLHELLVYSLQQSDNNASDILLQQMGGIKYVQDYLNRTNMQDIHIRHSECEMHEEPQRCYVNSSTPLAMACLLDALATTPHDSILTDIRHIIESCQTGKDRIPAPFHSTDIIIGHKTGTGFTLPDSRLMAVNDAAYLLLSNGQRYSITVFIENSGYDMDKTSALIAQIAKIVGRYIGALP
ncbi:MAG: class A beta-lactamase-related serine hydrolase [Clostridium sp.]|nr:class A beta-lactamase-related serine hydrolase [Clostridium sp.]